MLLLEQSKNEELLYEYLRKHRREVLWQTELESFSQDAGGVTARIKTAEGESQTIEAKYLVGCDGARSSVRHELGLSFEGSTFERLFYVVDAEIDWELPHDAIQVCLAREVFMAFFPMKGEKRYRIIGTFPEGADTEGGEVVYEEIEEEIKREAQLQLEITGVNWFSLYKVHSRRVNKFAEGRCFVAGDAAHIHSPAGAQGMNTGIQVRGRLDTRWEELFDGMTIAPKDDATTISGFVSDQAALHGLLARVRDFGLVLISVKSGDDEREFFLHE
jgi:2-polyprenyl-6-methoxyphenol hydroxylase-like FAD-dependent oxidoreductase